MSRGGMPGTLSESIVKLLREAKGNPVPRAEIEEAIYGLSPNSPDNERRALNGTISALRARGFNVECVICFRLTA